MSILQDSPTLFDYSNDGWRLSIDFEGVNLKKPIVELNRTDILFCLRKRIFLEPIIDHLLLELKANDKEIQQWSNNPTKLWFEEVVANLVSLPLSFWETKTNTFRSFQRLLKSQIKQELQEKVESRHLEDFLSHKPTDFAWSLEKQHEFEQNISYDILGNVILAFHQISQIKIAILNGQSVYLESDCHSLRSVEELCLWINQNYEDWADEILSYLEKEKKLPMYQTPHSQSEKT